MGENYNQNGHFAEYRERMPPAPLTAKWTKAVNNYWTLLSPLKGRTCCSVSGGGMLLAAIRNPESLGIVLLWSSVLSKRNYRTLNEVEKESNSQRTHSHSDPFMHSFIQVLTDQVDYVCNASLLSQSLDTKGINKL